MDNTKLQQIVRHFAAQDAERAHVEFKVDNADPKTIGENISGIANLLTKNNIPRGYIIWGVEDDSHSIVGTTFNPNTKKVGNEDLLLWLKKYLHPDLIIDFYTIDIDRKNVVILTIQANRTAISKFRSTAYIRVDKNTRKLADFPETEKQVWREIVSSSFETMSAVSNVTLEQAKELLDLYGFYELRKNRVPVERSAIDEEIVSCGIITDNKDSTYDITNLGALLFAKDLNQFSQLKLKAPRVIVYKGDSKIETIIEQGGTKGYAIGFEGLHGFVMKQLIEGEEIVGALRKNKYRFPSLTVRELLANILIHQDLSLEGTQPMVEIFSNRIVFTNAGRPIVPKDRFVDYPPTSRNQMMADELFKLGICEKRGTGWDKVAEETGSQRFPAPTVSTTDRHTVVTLMQSKTLADMTQEEKIWSLYINACFLWVKKQYTTNSTVRELFDIEEGNKATASRLLNQAVDAKKIRIFDEDAGTRSRKYVPIYELGDEV